MDESQQKALLLAAVSTMIAELDDRVGDENAYRLLDLNTYSIAELTVIKRTLHELLYAPPKRS